MIDFANRAVRRVRLGSGGHLADKAAERKTSRSREHGAIGIRLTALSIVRLVGTAGALSVLDIN